MSNITISIVSIVLGFLLALFFIKPKVETFTKTNVVYKDTTIVKTVFQPREVKITDIVTKWKTRDVVKEVVVKEDSLIYVDVQDTENTYKQYRTTFTGPQDSTALFEIYNVVQKGLKDTLYTTIQWLKNPKPDPVIITNTVTKDSLVYKPKSGFAFGATVSTQFINPSLGYITKKGHFISLGAAFYNPNKVSIIPTISYHKIFSK